MTKVSLISVLFLMEGGSNALVHPSRQIMTTGPSHQHCNFESSGPWRRNGCLSLAASSSDSEQKPPRKVKIRAAVKGSSSSTATISRTKKKTTTKTKTKKSKSVTKKAFKAGEMSKAKAIIDEPPAVEAMETEKEPPPKYWSQKPTIHTKSGAPWQHQEMMDHDILTKEEELTYGRRVVRAHELREKVDELLEEKRVEMEMRRLEMEEMQTNNDGGSGGGGNVGNELDYDFLSYELEYLSVYGFRPNKDMQGEMQQENSNSNNNNNNNLGGMDLNDDLLFEHSRHRSQHMSQLRDETQNFVGSNVGGPKRNGYRNSSTSTANRNSYTPLLHIPMHRLSESDVVRSLSVPGGKSELTDIMLDGAYARETLMRRNVKLVMSIAKNWMRNSFSTANANLSGGGSFESSGKDKSRSSRKFLSQMYEGSWDRPSLDEAMQEGMLGLARAVDKYDPERGLRFSTYATHWITSYVRVCFQRAVTGCLHVPSQLHDIKVAYNKIVKDHLHTGSDPPEQRSIAAQLGISEQRLTTAIRATGSLVSVDAPIVSSGGSAYKGSMAGGDGAGGNELLILDTLKCAEPKPEDQVEISFLRQCLENAMATELTPYERDVLRLRLGLDSGEGKTVREICKLAGGSVSMSDVRSAERRAFKKLRSPTSVHTHNLLAYLDLAGGEFGRSGVGGVGNSARR